LLFTILSGIVLTRKFGPEQERLMNISVPKEEPAVVNIVHRSSFWRLARGIFFEAMQQGYASSPPKRTLDEMPGAKTIKFELEKWRVLDTYIVTPAGNYSGGTTCLWYDQVPVWMMQYIGEYRPDAIPCLKAALRENYQKKKFYGGRGPEFTHFDDYTYINQVEENDFNKRVLGEETIFDAAGKKVGWHRYQAVWMVGKY
jgi:hypothetical protein